MKFAMDLESDALEFYKTCCEATQDTKLIGIFEGIISVVEKRMNILERVRRENVTEMILEPIKDLESDVFLLESITKQDFSNNLLIELAVRNEKKRQEFFETASEKIDFLIEAADAFERFAEQNQRNVDLLSSYS